jgi:hypothetical protein
LLNDTRCDTFSALVWADNHAEIGVLVLVAIKTSTLAGRRE